MLTIEKAREVAARIWCDQEMSGTVMDTGLCERIAQLLAGNDPLAWLESVMRPAESYKEVYLAGLRGGGSWDATAFQVEVQDGVCVNAPTLREALELAKNQHHSS